ncbi:MAG: putative KAP-like P-loop ATPase [Cognaticolwellia sp.]|jgi:predicted KAP-like P-loop ATPase
MVKRIELNWSNESKIENDSFPEDRLERAKYATFLTKLLAAQSVDSKGQNKNYVLNLNAEWGAGKTYFLKRWAEDIKEHYPVVYVDAWKKDYSDDPLMTVISSIIYQLRVQAGKNKDSPEFKVPRKLIGLLKATAPGIGRGLVKRYLGFDPVEVMNANDEDESIGTVQDEKGNDVDMSFAASEMVKYLIDEHDAKSKAVDSLKSSVLEWVGAVVGLKNKSLPAFIFIDELDRCRPSYAVEMLETIKHIFDIKGVVFIVATDTEQLQHAVKAIYGEGFDAKIYLSRFFNSRYSLKAPNLENFLEVHCDKSKLSGDYFRELGIEVLPVNENGIITLKNISVILEAFHVSARTAIQITDRVIATIANMPRGSKVDILMLTTLLCIKESDSALFNEIVRGKFEKKVVKGDQTLNQYLPEFLENNLAKSSLNKKIEMIFDPKEFIDVFEIHNRGTQKNAYPSGSYYFNLLAYLQNIFSSHFESVKKSSPILNFGGNRSENTPKETPLQKVSKELLNEFNGNKANILESSSILWMEFFYINNKFSAIAKDEYRDFVELASPLDWMGKDDLTD